MGGALRRIRVQSSITREGLGSCSSLYCCSYCLKQAWNGQLAPNARVLLLSWKHLLHAINQVLPWCTITGLVLFHGCYHYRSGSIQKLLLHGCWSLSLICYLSRICEYFKEILDLYAPLSLALPHHADSNALVIGEAKNFVFGK